MLRSELQKWTKTISVSLSRQLAYKLDFLLTLILPPLVLVAVSYSLWGEIFDREGLREIGGFTREQMLRYQCWTFVAALLIRSHRSWNLSDDIRYGRITAFLLYPFSVWGAYASDFIAFQLIQLCVVVLVVGVLCVCGFIPAMSLTVLLTGIVFSLLVGALWFLFEFLFGLIAFWLEETWVLRTVFNFLTLTLSGSFIPIELFPSWFQDVLRYTPFPLLTSIPVHIFLGSARESVLFLSLKVIFWMVVVGLGARALWRRGIRMYSAAGM